MSRLVRPIGGTWAAVRLAGARVRRRRGPAALVGLSVAATIAVLGALFGVAAEAADVAIHDVLAKQPVADRSIAIERFTSGVVRQQEADDRARQLLGRLADVTDPIVTLTWFPPTTGPSLVFAVDDPGRYVSVTSGRLPAPCSGGPRCEAVAVTGAFKVVGTPPLPTTSVGDLPLDIVGTVELKDDFPVNVPATSGDPVLVNGSDLVTNPATLDVPRESFWIAPLSPDRFHAWLIDDVRTRVDDIRREIALSDAAMTLESPDRTFTIVVDRAAVTNGRIVFIGSLIVAVLFAFAFFAAAIDRDDLRSEYSRLVVAGARRRHLLALVLTEALVPSLGGALVGWLVAIGVVLAIGSAGGVTAADLLRGSLLSAGATTFVGGAAIVLAVAVAIGLHPGASHFVHARGLALAALPVVGVLIWDVWIAGPLTAGELSGGAYGPGLVLLPGLLGLTVILASLAVLPPIFRGVAARSRQLPLPLRLALLSIAREPLRPAATLTLLGFSFGSAVFGLGYGATLHQGAVDAAAYATGQDIRIVAPSEQTPFVRQVIDPIAGGILGSDVTMSPIARYPAATATGSAVTILGIDPAVTPQLKGWRSDFSDRSARDLQGLIAQPGDWTLPGHPLPTGARQLAVTLDADLEPDPSGIELELRAVIDTADGAFRSVALGSLAAGRQTYRASLFGDAELAAEPANQPSGWRLVAIVASLPDLENGFGPPVEIRGTVTVEGLPELADATQPIDLDVSIERDRQVIRGPVATDGLVLPAIVTPALLAEQDSAGHLSIELPSGLVLHVRPVAQATWFPTMTDPLRASVIVDRGPLLLAVNAFAPGQGLPNEALLATPNDTRTAQVVEALGKDPFPGLTILSRPVLESLATSDPFALGVATTLLVGAVAGLALALAGMLLAATAELRDERGELADLEEQGLRPSSLRRLAGLRSMIVLVAALAIGVLLGVGLTWFGTAAIAIGTSDTPPVPPLAVVVPWPLVVGLSAGLAVAVGGGTLLLGRGRFGERRLLPEVEA